MSSSTSASRLRRGILTAASFLLALFVLDRGFFLVMRSLELRYYGKSDFERRLAAYLKDRHFSTLLFGTSRAYEGVIPAQLEPCLKQRIFKETFQGKGPKYNLHFYRLFKKHASVPRVVVYCVDYFIYSIESDPRWMSRFRADDPADAPSLLAAPLLLLRQKRHNDLFFNNLLNDLADAAARTPPRDDTLFDEINEYPGAPTAADNPRLFTEVPPSYPVQYMPQWPGTEGKYFERLLRELLADGVRVALVSLPDYIGTYKTNLEMETFHQVLRDYRVRYPNVTLLLYNNPRRFDLANPAYFLDGGWGRTNSHLSARGAAELSGRLCHDLAPLYRR